MELRSDECMCECSTSICLSHCCCVGGCYAAHPTPLAARHLWTYDSVAAAGCHRYSNNYRSLTNDWLDHQPDDWLSHHTWLVAGLYTWLGAGAACAGGISHIHHWSQPA